MPNLQSIFQLFYVSSAAPDCDSNKIDLMLEKARRYNISEDLTGILLFRGGIFLQLLEGEEEKVNRLYEKIVSNPLHRNLIQMFTKKDNSRLFSGWSMAYREVSEIDVAMVNEILSWNKLISANPGISNEVIVTMLERFKNVQKKQA